MSSNSDQLSCGELVITISNVALTAAKARPVHSFLVPVMTKMQWAIVVFGTKIVIAHAATQEDAPRFGNAQMLKSRETMLSVNSMHNAKAVAVPLVLVVKICSGVKVKKQSMKNATSTQIVYHHAVRIEDALMFTNVTQLKIISVKMIPVFLSFIVSCIIRMKRYSQRRKNKN